MVELVISLAIISALLVASLNTVAAARTGEYKIAQRGRALLLAQGLMAEILRQAYADPAYGPGSFGIGADEVTGNRSLFDDVDDYHGWTASPPQYKNGSVIPATADYEERVTVAWVNPSNLEQTSGSETGIKRIEVTIRYQGQPVLTLVAFRTQAWRSPTELRAGS